MKETNQEQGYREAYCRLRGSGGAFLRAEFLFSSGKDQEQSFSLLGETLTVSLASLPIK